MAATHRESGMYEIADALDQLPEAAWLVRLADLTGFGSRSDAEAVALDHEGRAVAGSLLAGTVDHVLAMSPLHAGEIRTRVGDAEAEAAGLACGGRARLLAQPLDSVPGAAWEALRAGVGLVLGTVLEGSRTRAVVDGADPLGTTGDDALDTLVDERAATLLRTGRSTRELVGTVLVESFLPPTTLRIVGRAAVGEALAAQADLLGWRCEVIDAVAPAVDAAGALASHDALVVLSHDPAVDTPTLAAALAHERGFVGALGSRSTQQARRERLRGLGLHDAQLARLHGPVGLDLGARTPAETALAIAAEILAQRSGRAAGALTTTDGPING